MNDTDTQADGYYDEPSMDGDLDLSFLDDESEE